MSAPTPRRAIIQQRQAIGNRQPDRAIPPAPEGAELVAANQNFGQHDPRITGTWSSPETDVVDDEVEEIVEEIVREPAAFVRCLTHVGTFQQGSVVPTTTFEHVDRLIQLGAVEYDYTASEAISTGNPGDMASGMGVLSAAVHNIPNAPWVHAAAHNLLGNTYVSLAHTNRPWTPAPPPKDPHLIDDGPTVTLQMGEPNQV